MRRQQPEQDRWARGVEAGVLLALAYPDRVAQRRPGSRERYLLRNGLGARVRPQALGAQEYLVAAELDGRLPESEILLGAPISLGEIRSIFAADIAEESVVEWDPGAEAVRAVRRERLGALVLREGTLADPEPERVTDALLEGIRRDRRWAPSMVRTARRGSASGSNSSGGSTRSGRT